MGTADAPLTLIAIPLPRPLDTALLCRASITVINLRLRLNELRNSSRRQAPGTHGTKVAATTRGEVQRDLVAHWLGL